MSNCLQCNKEFESKRDTAKYCSDSCKKRYQRSFRGTEPQEVSGTPLSGTRVVTPEEKMELVDYTDEDALKFMEGKKSICKKCDKEFTEEDGKYWYLIEVCLDCTKKS